MFEPDQNVAEAEGAPNSEEASDETLVLIAKSGDHSAFRELSKRHAKKLLPRIYRITRNWEDAEDVLQDSLLNAYRHLNGFEGRSTFATWLTRIAINSALMLLRKRHLVEVPLDAPALDKEGWNEWEIRDESKNLEDRFLLQEQKEWLNQAILQLSPHLRSAICLRQAEDWSTHEIAQALGISEAAAKSRLARARTALRGLLV